MAELIRPAGAFPVKEYLVNGPVLFAAGTELLSHAKSMLLAAQCRIMAAQGAAMYLEVRRSIPKLYGSVEELVVIGRFASLPARAGKDPDAWEWVPAEGYYRGPRAEVKEHEQTKA